MPFISVIVPVYRVEPYLHRCVDSILAQTFTDLELILIDDGSPDGSGAICEEYAARDSRIVVIHQTNGGVSRARNCGIDISTGDYITFVDSDDYIDNNYLADFPLGNDLACQTAVLEDEEGNYLGCPYADSEKEEYQYVDSDIISNALLSGRLNWTSCKMFYGSIIQQYGIRFDTAIDLAEDTLFAVDYLTQAHTLLLENKSNYRYVRYKSRKTLGRGFDDDRIPVVKIANRKISESLYPSDPLARRDIYYRRMLRVYHFMLEDRYEFHTLKNWSEDIRLLLSLKKDEDFNYCCKQYEVPELPNAVKKAVLEQCSWKIVVTHTIWRIRCVLARVKRKCKRIFVRK